MKLNLKGVEKNGTFKKHSDETVSPSRKLVHISFERWDPQLHLDYKNISVQYQGAEQTNVRYQISRILNNEQYNILKSDTTTIYA